MRPGRIPVTRELAKGHGVVVQCPAMYFTTHTPRLELREHVERLWYYDGLSPVHRLERVLPDGTFELIVNLRDDVRHVFSCEEHRPVAAYRRAWLSGAHSRHIVIDTAPNSSMMGAHFKPGGAAAVLGLPATALSNQVVELDAVWGQVGVDLRDALLEAPTPAAKFRVLEDFLLLCGQRARGGHPAVRHALRRLVAEPTTRSIAAVADELGFSHKHLIQRFRDEVGLTPKRFCRIRRFRQVLQAVEARRGIEWADLAADCGYFDQAHFIHEFREFSGLNPSAYLQQRGEYLGHVPVSGRG